MESIIDPIDKQLIKAELTPERFQRKTRKANNEIYIVNWRNAPHTLKEIGRLREIAFRQAGGGSGLGCDLDEYDTMDEPYQQLILWNPDAEEIIGGYRFLEGRKVRFDEHGHPMLATAHMFGYSEQFIRDYLPHTLELGRSFVVPEYQSSQMGAKSLFALDNLWDGLGALTIDLPSIKHYFGKFTMYPDYGEEGRNMILYFLHKYFPDPDRLVYPFHPLQTNMDVEKLEKLFSGDSFKENYTILNTQIRALGSAIPPLVNAYMNLSPTMRLFGTAINDEFGDVEESGILVTISEMFDEKRDRHIDSYQPTGALII